MPHIQSPVVRLGEGNEFAEIFWRQVFVWRDQPRIQAEYADGREIDIWPVWKVGVERRRSDMGPQMPDLDGVAIGLGAHRPRRCDGAPGPGDVLDYKRLPEGPRQGLCHNARNDIGRSAGAEGND